MLSFLPEDIIGAVLKHADTLSTFKLAFFVGNRVVSNKVLKGATHVRFDLLSDLILPQSLPPTLESFGGLVHIKIWASYTDFHPTAELIMSLPPTVRYLNIRSAKALECFQKRLPIGVFSIRHRSGYNLFPLWLNGPVLLNLDIMFPHLEHLQLENASLSDNEPTNILELLLRTLPSTVTCVYLTCMPITFDPMAVLPASVTSANLWWSERGHSIRYDTSHLTNLTSLQWQPSSGRVSHFSSTLSHLTHLILAEPESFKLHCPLSVASPSLSLSSTNYSASSNSLPIASNSDNEILWPGQLYSLDLRQPCRDLRLLSHLPPSLRCLRFTDPILADVDLSDIPSTLTELHVTLGFPMLRVVFPLFLTTLNAPLKHRVDFLIFAKSLPKTLTHLSTSTNFLLSDEHMKALPAGLTHLSARFHGPRDGFAHQCPTYTWLPPLLTYLSLGTLASFDPSILIPILPPTLCRLCLPDLAIPEAILDRFPPLADFNCSSIVIDCSHLSSSSSSSSSPSSSPSASSTTGKQPVVLNAKTITESLARCLHRITSRTPLLETLRYLDDTHDVIHLKLAKELAVTDPRFEVIELPMTCKFGSLLEQQGHLVTRMCLFESQYSRKQMYHLAIQQLTKVETLEIHESWTDTYPLPTTLTSLYLDGLNKPDHLHTLHSLKTLHLGKFKLMTLYRHLPPQLTSLRINRVPLDDNISPGFASKLPQNLKQLVLETTTWEVLALRELPKSLELLRVGCISLNKWEAFDSFSTLIRLQKQREMGKEPSLNKESNSSGGSSATLPSDSVVEDPSLCMVHGAFLKLVMQSLSDMCGFKVEVTQTANHADTSYSINPNNDRSPAFSKVYPNHLHVLSICPSSITRLDITGAEANLIDTSVFRLMPRTLTQLKLAPESYIRLNAPSWNLPRHVPVPADPWGTVNHFLHLPPHLTALDYFCTITSPAFVQSLSPLIQHLGIALALTEDSSVSWPPHLQYLNILSPGLYMKAKESLPDSLRTLVSMEFSDRLQAEYMKALPRHLEVFQLITAGSGFGRSLPLDHYQHLRFVSSSSVSSPFRDPTPTPSLQ